MIFLYHYWNEFTFSLMNKVDKVSNFYEELRSTMNRKQFRRWFRMDPPTFAAMSEILQIEEPIQMMGKKTMNFIKQFAMTLTFLRTQMPSYQ